MFRLVLSSVMYPELTDAVTLVSPVSSHCILVARADHFSALSPGRREGTKNQIWCEKLFGPDSNEASLALLFKCALWAAGRHLGSL